jgi:hypothetical protein
VRAVGADDVAGADGADVAARDVAERDLGALGQVLDADHLGAEPNLRATERAQVLQQYGLEVVLGHAGGSGRAEEGGLLARRDADRPHRPLSHRRQGVRLPSSPLDVDGAREDGVLEAPRADQLHRAQAHHGGAGQRGQLGAALHEHRLHAEPGQRDRRRQPSRTGPRDDHW